MAVNGKWRKYRGKLPAFVDNEPGRAEKIDKAKAKYIGLDVKEMGRQFRLAKLKKKELERDVKLQNIEIDAMNALMLNELEGSGVESLALDTGDSFSISDEPYVSVKSYEKVIAWIKRNPQFAYLLGVQWQKLNAACKVRLIEAKPGIPGTELFIKTKIRMTKAGSDGTDEGDEDAED